MGVSPRRRTVTEVTTPQAAAACGCSVPAFRQWASRARLHPVRRVRVGRSTVATWDLNEVLERRVLPQGGRSGDVLW